MRTFTIYSFTACCLFSIAATRAQEVNVTIIESEQTGEFWEVQDSLWFNAAVALGYEASVVSQSTLDDDAFYESTDILVISSATTAWGSLNETIRYPIVLDYIKQGKAIYIQSEYLDDYPGNRLWEAMMDSINGAFQWTGTVSGLLSMVNVIGTIGSMPHSVSEVGYYQYGQSGVGDVEYFIEYQGVYLGFYYQDTVNGYGRMITQSDQDWVWMKKNPPLMENILFRLSGGINSGIQMIENNSLSVYPNPASDRIFFQLPSNGSPLLHLTVSDNLGRQIVSRELEVNQDVIEVDVSSLSVGMYVLRVQYQDKSYVAKFVK
jgi:hypothetical protein